MSTTRPAGIMRRRPRPWPLPSASATWHSLSSPTTTRDISGPTWRASPTTSTSSSQLLAAGASGHVPTPGARWRRGPARWWLTSSSLSQTQRRSPPSPGALRTAWHFGAPAVDYQSARYPAGAAEALGALDQAYGIWVKGVASLTDEDLARPVGEVEPFLAGRPFAALVLHIHREAIHHLAEVLVLRDLYRAQR